MKTTEQKAKFIELRAKDWSFNKIAEELQVSKPTLIEWAKEFNKDIANLKSMEMEILQKKYYLQKKQRIELYGDYLEDIKEILKERIQKDKLEDMRTAELFELFFKYRNKVEAEYTPVEFEEDWDLNQLDSIKTSFKAN